MVTGIETAGLVLASLPIVVQVLTEYRSGLRKTMFILGKSKAYQSKIGKLARHLKILHTNLHQVLTIAIGTAAPDEWSGDVLRDYQSQIWTGEAGKKIRNYFEAVDAFDTFEMIIEDFEDCISDVTENLSGLLAPPAADIRDLRALVDAHSKNGGHFRLRGRVDFLMKESQIDKVVEELNNLSDSLGSLVGNSDSIHQMKQLKASSKQSQYAKSLRATKLNQPRFALSMGENSTTTTGGHIQIGDMCRVLLEIRPQDLLVSADSRIFRSASHCTTSSLQANESHDIIELSQFLFQGRNLSPVDKYSFGLSIASSLLQLNLTPWICKCWTKDDIILRHEKNADSGYDMARPLIRGRFEKMTTCERSDDNPDVALLELGILLVELWTAKTFESWVESTGRATSDLSNLALRRGLLYDWWCELKKKAPPSYCQVVQTCFFALEFGEVNKSWDDVQFKALYYTNLVEPLSKDLEQLREMQ
ncbi:MAG: hypothetical protein Q9208_005358 [Pyrenodesmia sp. 3 TL-2023]